MDYDQTFAMAKHRHIKAHHRVLEFVATSTLHNFNIALKNTPSLVKAIKYVFRYILNGTLKMKPHHIKKLRPHKKYIRKVAHGRESVVQKGGSILQTILSIVVPLIKNIL